VIRQRDVTRQRDAAASQDDPPAGEAGTIRVRLDELLSQRGMTLTGLSAQVDVTVVNLSILKNGRARAIRFSTLARLCEALDCQPGDLLSYEPPAGRATAARSLDELTTGAVAAAGIGPGVTSDAGRRAARSP
jgi:putative transcriptional regulator